MAMQKESDDRVDLWQNSCEVLFQTVVESNDLLQSLYMRMSALEEDYLEMKEEVKSLSDKCRVLDEKNDTLTLMTGQLAVEIERKIVDTVLLDLLTSDQHMNTIADMETAIRGNSDDDDDVFETDDGRDTARSRWLNLKSRFSWKGKHTRYIQELKRERNLIANPSVDRRKIEEALKTGAIKVRDEKLFKEFLKIHENLDAASS